MEDYVSALVTGDPNKQKVYTDGFDSHSMRALAYYPEKMPDIVNKLEEADKPNLVYFKQFNEETQEYEYFTKHRSEL